MDPSLDATLLHLTRTRLLQHIPAQINACLDVLDEDDLWWRPNEASNAAGNLVVHLSWSNRYYLEQVIGGRDVGRNRDAEFADRTRRPKSDVRRIWDEAQRMATGVLDALTPAQLTSTTDRTGERATYAQILLHVTHHNATHMGQIVWITKMRHPGSLDDIWRKFKV